MEPIAKLIGMALIAAMMPVLAHAATESDFAASTTGELLALCSAKRDAPLATEAVNFCEGFAQGAVMVELQHDAASRGAKLFCLPSPAPTRTETLEAFMTWASASPSRLAQRATDGLFGFLAERFPCPEAR